MSYKYRLYKDGRDEEPVTYTLDELNCMGTFMLRDICVREKIMTRSASLDAKRLGREALIELLYRYRGKKEESLLEDFPAESVDLLRRLAKRADAAAEKLELPSKIELKNGIPLLEDEDVLVRHGFEGEYFLGLWEDGEGDILAVFEVRGNRMSLSPGRISKKLLAGLYRDVSVLLFDAPSSLRAVQAYNSQKWDQATERGLIAAKTRLPILSIVEAQDSEEPLVIDFGAGNTSAASQQQDRILSVRFQGGSLLCPSTAAVERCGRDQVHFRFGFEALSLIRRDGYGSAMTFLHNLKLYLFEERPLEVCDHDGNAATVSSDTVLREFFRYIICLAKAEHGRNYKKITFLTPEKRGSLALSRLQKLLPEYEVADACSESLNSVYQKIMETIGDRGDLLSAGAPPGGMDPEWEEQSRILAFHCGAGASSLVACEYGIENTNVAYKVGLKHQYLNGDSGFGGNNLTCLIFMYLKIRVSQEIRGVEEEILDEPFAQAYSYVDQYGSTGKVYERFIRLYEEAEGTVPTKFGLFEERQPLKRQNFYRLWFLAEHMKTAFFSGNPLSLIKLPDQFAEFSAVNGVFPDGIREYRLDFSVQKAEVEMVIAPEIYRIVKSFIEPLCDEYGILSGYQIRFTGLCCHIPVFRDALREFTVGRRARTGAGTLHRLKLRAMEGAVFRDQLQKNGRIIPKMTEMEAAVSYLVNVTSHDGNMVQIVSGAGSQDCIFGYVMRHGATRQVDFMVCDLFGSEVRKRQVALNIHAFQEMGYDLFFNVYPMFREHQGDFDSIGEEEIRLFVFREENWDFCVLPAARQAGRLRVGNVSRFLFDDESADYFSGRY